MPQQLDSFPASNDRMNDRSGKNAIHHRAFIKQRLLRKSLLSMWRHSVKNTFIFHFFLSCSLPGTPPNSLHHLMLFGLDLCLLWILLIEVSCVVYPNSLGLALLLKMTSLSSCELLGAVLRPHLTSVTMFNVGAWPPYTSSIIRGRYGHSWQAPQPRRVSLSFCGLQRERCDLDASGMFPFK